MLSFPFRETETRRPVSGWLWGFSELKHVEGWSSLSAGHWRRLLSPPKVPPALCSSCPAWALGADWSHRLTSEGQTQLGDEALGIHSQLDPRPAPPPTPEPRAPLPPLQLYVGLNCCLLRVGNEHSRQRCCSGDTLGLYLLVSVLFIFACF